MYFCNLLEPPKNNILRKIGFIGLGSVRVIHLYIPHPVIGVAYFPITNLASRCLALPLFFWAPPLPPFPLMTSVPSSLITTWLMATLSPGDVHLACFYDFPLVDHSSVLSCPAARNAMSINMIHMGGTHGIFLAASKCHRCHQYQY